MIKQSDVYTRRILNFPAIRPCESVSFPSLVASLITLSRTICDYKSKTFFTNKKNARNSIRLIEGLCIFLEEIGNVDSRIENSIVLSLSELHFVLQKVQFLLEDCTRDDAKVFLLMKAGKISMQLRSFMRAIGVALDVLPLKRLDVSVEVQELIEFVKGQALKSSFEMEMEDSIVIRKVQCVFDQFESGIAPKRKDLRMILEYLCIAKWSDCNKEVKFLENEIGLEKKEMKFLSDLMGFVIYCRCTLFDVVDIVSTRRFDSECNNEIIRFLNPDDFRCPVTLELMTDPVTLSTGHTYDRSSILKWFSAGNHTCPKTGERLMATDLVPNIALKQLIKQYCSQNGIAFAESGGNTRDISRKVDVGSVAAQQAMKLVANDLVGRLLIERNEVQNKIVYEIRLLTKTSAFNRSCLVEAGVIPALLILLSSMNPSTQETAIAALMNLSKYPGSKKIIVENGGLILILDVLQEGLKVDARAHAAGALFYLASIEEYRAMIGEIPEFIPGLVNLLRNGTDRGKKNALATIFGLLTYQENQYKVLEAGLVPLLIKSFEKEDLTTDSLAILATLAERRDGTMAILYSKALPTIVEVFASCNSMGTKEYCVSLLLSLCINGGADAVRVLVKNQSLMAPLYSLLTGGTPRASKKASTLIRMLHEFNDRGASGLIAPVLAREQSIHVW